MKTYGQTGTYVSATGPIDLPRPRRRKHRPARQRHVCPDCTLPLVRPGAFHVCLDLSAPEAVIVKTPKKAKAKKVRKPKPTGETRAQLSPEELERRRERDRLYKKELRARTTCANGCGAKVSKIGNRCVPCMAASRKTFTAEQEAQVARLYTIDLLNTKQIAAQLGVASNTVRLALERQGIARRKPTGRPRKDVA